MEIKKIESRIKKLKAKLTETKKNEGAEKSAAAIRGARKKVKRAQRRKKSLLTRTAFIEAKGKKKAQKGAEGEKGTAAS